MYSIVAQIYSDRLQAIRNAINLHITKIVANPLFKGDHAQLNVLSYEEKIKYLVENEALLRTGANPQLLNMIGVI